MEKKVQSPEHPSGSIADDEGRRRGSRPKRSYYTPEKLRGWAPGDIFDDAAPSYVRNVLGFPSWSEDYATMQARRSAIAAREKEERRMRRWHVKAARALRRWCFRLGCTSVPPPKKPPRQLNPATHASRPLPASRPPRVTHYVVEPGCSPRKLEPVFGCDGTVIRYECVCVPDLGPTAETSVEYEYVCVDQDVAPDVHAEDGPRRSTGPRRPNERVRGPEWT